jgi:hypothetical protein
MKPTPETDAETYLTTLDCDDSCVDIYLKRGDKAVEGDFVLADFARKLERERDEARSQLYRICREGFGNDDTIGLEPADDYALRKLAELRQALSGRTVSCSQCNGSARTIEEMRATMQIIYDATECCADGAPDASDHDKLCNEIAATLKPFIK